MNVIKVNLPKSLKQIKIVPLADIHFGDPNCNVTALRKVINYIKDTPDCYCILNGDLINNATKNSCSDIYAEFVPPSKQLEQVSELLNPIKDKILCITGGNHEFRTWKMDGIDLTALLARELGCGNRYAPNSAVLFLKLGQKEKDHKSQQVQYSIFINHGCGGGRKIGGKLGRLEDVVQIVDCDVYIHSHTHLPAVFKQNFFRTNLPHQSIEEVEKTFVNTNAFLNYGGYGETYEFRPASRSVPIIVLSGTERNVDSNFIS
jgi:predicted phosphodiesterase